MSVVNVNVMVVVVGLCSIVVSLDIVVVAAVVVVVVVVVMMDTSAKNHAPTSGSCELSLLSLPPPPPPPPLLIVVVVVHVDIGNVNDKDSDDAKTRAPKTARPASVGGAASMTTFQRNSLNGAHVAVGFVVLVAVLLLPLTAHNSWSVSTTRAYPFQPPKAFQ
jgi:hypothetical protein